MTQEDSEKLFDQWLRKGRFIKSGISYVNGINNDSAIRAMIPSDKKMVGKVCNLPSELTLTNADLDDDYHEGFTIGKGKTFYWLLIWHKSGHCTVYSKNKASPRYISGDSLITVHFK
jgi:hypothetical protein